MDSSEHPAATAFDLLDYLDDLPLEASHLTNCGDPTAPTQPQEQQQQGEGHHRQEDEETLEDTSSEYIDVTVAWTTRSPDRPLSGTTAKDDRPRSSSWQQQHERSNGADGNNSSGNNGNPTHHNARSRLRHADRDAREDLRWQVDLSSKLLVSTNGTLEKFHLNKWRETLQLNKLMAAPCFHAIRLAGDDRSLFESFHRAFPHEMVTKARFVSVLRSVYGIDDGVRRKLRREETDLCRHLDKMQYSFELSPDGVACVNWRVLLSALRMLQEPLLGVKEHFAWMFSVHSSSGFLERPKDSDAINASQATQILTHFLRSRSATRFVSERISRAIELLPAGTGSSSRMTYRRFKELLQQSPVKALFKRATPHTSCFDELASPLYREFVFKHRKREHDIRTIKRLRYLHATRSLRSYFFVWTQLARVRKRTRALVAASCGTMARVKRMWAFLKLKNHAIASIAAIEVQRTFRGFLGRRVGEDQWRLVQAVIKVQGAFRMRLHFAAFLKNLRRRNQLAVRVQRVYRGRLGRVRVRRRVIEYYYAEMAKLQQERDAFREYVRNELAKRVQRFFRSLVREKRERRVLEEAFASRKLEKEREEAAQNAVRAAKRYRRDVSAAYDKLREEEEYKRQRKQIDGLEKQKVVRLRRQRQWDVFKKVREDRKEQIKLQSAEAYERVKREWDAKIAERAQKKKLFVTQILLSEEPGEWKALQQSLKRLIKERKKALATRYKSSGVAVPNRELEERAQLEIVEEEEASERQKAEEDWIRAEAEFLNKLDEEEEMRAMAENTDERVRREKSAMRVQSVFRMFAARKILRQEIRALFVKEFDAERQVAVYRNTFSGARSQRKPFGLGSEDLAYSDQWFLLADPAIGESFFYNPLRMLQSWEKPDECRLCGSCASLAFAELWNARDDSFWCQQCFLVASGLGGVDGGDSQPSASFSADDFFAYDGSRPKGGY